MLRPTLLQLDHEVDPDERPRPPRRPGDTEAEASGADGDDQPTTTQPRPTNGGLLR